MIYDTPLCAALALASLALAGCSSPTQPCQSDAIRVDQCGYLPTEDKVALLFAEGSKFKVLDENQNVAFSGNVGAAAYWPEAGDSVRLIDFSALNADGRYTILVDDSLLSFPFVISPKAHACALRMAARAFYYNRASMPISSECGGRWARPAGHPDTLVLVHKSAASAPRPEGYRLSLPGGWYDAGDYNKYIVNSSISTYTLLLASNLFASVTDTLSLGIPESGSAVPDLTSETLYNLRWMLSMQDPNDGGVYTKLTSLSFEGFIMPADCHKQRYVVAKSTAAALDLAATAAYAARVLPLRSESLKALADSCASVASRAYEWAKANPNVIFKNPDDVSTGEYGDGDVSDEWFWAATEMWLLTGSQVYAADAAAHAHPCGVPSWGSVAPLAFFSMADAGRAVPGVDYVSALKSVADSLVALDVASPARVGMVGYDWGSNSTVANSAMVKALAFKASGVSDYLASLRNDIHYLFGRNATGYSFVTGVGSRSPMHIHHRPSSADGVDDPVPGFLAGGPNTIVPTDCGGVETRSAFPAKAYADQECSYSTNEVAINWNAPLVFALLADLSLQ
ncbi:MAG: glycoside hydrolase family 9 protein [Marinilabiliaceae bacterium]